jgi:hypothetical protein
MMATITTDIEIDMDNFSDRELREELEYRGYSVSSDPDSFNKIDELSDVALVDELQHRGYVIYYKKTDVPFQIYQSYLLDTPDQFKKNLEQIFIENGLKP